MFAERVKFRHIFSLVLAALLIISIYYLSIDKGSISSSMVGTWFFNNPMGDDEQMAIFKDGRVVVLYSNGHRDETYFEDDSVSLLEYDDMTLKVVVVEDEALLQYAEGFGLAKYWYRVDSEPRTDLLRALTGTKS